MQRERPSIRQVLSLPRRFPDIRIDGADVCAGRILDFLNSARISID
ncbi:MAG TPA: hypothetical protein VEF34_06900 [Syntrophobacteraceae bacterium]|nr:hypothetical protein [Syntrophobacteraceae bacterium]